MQKTIDTYLKNTLLHNHHRLLIDYSDLTLIQIDFSYSELAKSSNQSEQAKKDIQKLTRTLLSKNYVSGYAWVMEFNAVASLHFHVIFYLNEVQCKELAYIASEVLWEEITENEGYVEEHEPMIDWMDLLASMEDKVLFKHDVACCIGVSHSS